MDKLDKRQWSELNKKKTIGAAAITPTEKNCQPLLFA
jgi:hypothetical protein